MIDVAPPVSVLFVSSTLTGGGAERFVSTVLGCLDRGRVRPSLCLAREEISYPLPPDVPHRSLDKRRPWHIPRAIARLSRLIDREGPDVVLSAFSHPSFLTGNALRLARRSPAWVARVSADPARTDRGPLRWWMQQLYRRADLVVANAESLCARFEQVHGRGARHLPNATDFAALDAAAAEPADPAPAGRQRIVGVGRLVRVKRFDLLLDALSLLPGELDAELVICGEGEERRRLEAQAAGLGLRDRVRLPGFVANPWAWIASADVFALCSDSEGLPNALVEAQGLGRPAVATDCPTGPGEVVVDGETGRLVPRGNAPALARALAELLCDEARRSSWGRAARERARARYSAAPVTRKLEDLLVEVSRRSSG